jgi:tetratricopeptide (TPR) repeat protein
MIRGEDWEGALQAFKAALAEDSQDDRAAFGAGVVCEKLGNYEEALKYYRNACVIEDELEYAEARDRVKRFIGRAAGASG